MSVDTNTARQIDGAVEAARQELIVAADSLRMMLGIEDEYPEETYRRAKTAQYARGKLDGLRLARRIIRGEL